MRKYYADGSVTNAIIIYHVHTNIFSDTHHDRIVFRVANNSVYEQCRLSLSLSPPLSLSPYICHLLSRSSHTIPATIYSMESDGIEKKIDSQSFTGRGKGSERNY